MAKAEKPGSFEITDYSEDHEIPGRSRGIIKEILQAMVRKNPAMSVQAVFVGNLMKITYHSYEMHLPVRIKEVESAAKSNLDETCKHLKKEYKTILKKTLDMKERKEMANTSVQKVSLNERYMYASWRFYELAE